MSERNRMDRREFIRRTAGATTVVGFAHCGFVEEPRDQDLGFQPEGETNLVCRVPVSGRAREEMRTSESFRNVLVDDVAAAARQALDVDAGISVRDRFVAGVADVQIDC